MKYRDGRGKQWYISREEARQIDRDEGRKRLQGNGLNQMITLQALRHTLDTKLGDLMRFGKPYKTHRLLRAASSMIKSYINKTMEHVSVEQICAIQGSFAEAYITVTNSQIPNKISLDETQVQTLIGCARGALRDMSGKPYNCSNCLSCMDKNEWQQCELYCCLNTMPANVPIAHNPDDVCPYSY